MRSVALALSVALLGCFPHNAKARRVAQLSEGAAIVSGIGMEFLANSGADCNSMHMLGQPATSCSGGQTALSGLGFAMILGGLVGFIATVSTAEEDKPATPAIDIKADKPADKPEVKLPPGVAPPNATPAAAPATAADPAPAQ